MRSSLASVFPEMLVSRERINHPRFHPKKMNATDYNVVVYDSEEYCNGCLPKGITTDHPEVSPIFSDAEMDRYPTCYHCGEKHTYVCLTPDGVLHESISGNHAEIFLMSADEFSSAQDSGTWMEESMYNANVDWDDPESVKIESEALAGWYWWTCLPGCLPDSDAFGPFKTELDAARDNLD